MLGPIFYPDENFKKNTKLYGFLDFVNSRHSLGLEDYWQLHTWSINQLGDFWQAIWDFCKIEGELLGPKYIPNQDFSRSQFFPDSKLNFSENLLMRGEDDDLALTSVNELGQVITLSRQELRVKVVAVAQALLAVGVEPGDRVVAWSSNTIEPLIFALGALSIGAVVSTCSTDFAAPAVIDRFGQIQPKVLLASPSYYYGGKYFSKVKELKRIVDGLPSLEEVVVVGEVLSEFNFEAWDSWIEKFKNHKIQFQRFPFNHPCFILFSSGTTGKPKCIVHKSGAVLLKLLSEHVLHLDIGYDSKVLYFTTTGWMMWNWLLVALGTGASVVLYDGSPTFPQVHRLMKLAEDFSVTHLGISPKYAELLKQESGSHLANLNLHNLVRVMSTGSPLSSECFEFLYKSLPRHVVTTSISGGTDLCGCFLHAIPTEPVYSGEIQGPALGFKMNVLGDDGQELAYGEKGELVCEKPFPSIPLGFWEDLEDRQFKSAYFEKFQDVWTHGDFASKTINGGYIIHGRSDATLNSRGVRIGTAEIYSIVDSLPEINESLAVSRTNGTEIAILLFVVLKPNYDFSYSLEDKIKKALKNSASPRHVPDFIFQAPELPRTKSNKLMELAVSDLVNGRVIRNYDSLRNPSSLEWFRNFSLNFHHNKIKKE